MTPLLETVEDWEAGAERLRTRRYGVIEVIGGRLQAIHLRAWPAQATLIDVGWLGKQAQRREQPDRCLLYYNQPRRQSTYLALKYVVSSPGTTLRTFRGTLVVLDEIARLKRTDAIVCDVSNSRISQRLLTRWGWEPHFAASRRRHFIKRFYGEFPPCDSAWADLLGQDVESLPNLGSRIEVSDSAIG